MRANKVGLGSLTQKARTTKAVALDHAGRVKSIILNESHPRFEEAGGYTERTISAVAMSSLPLGGILRCDSKDECFPSR